MLKFQDDYTTLIATFEDFILLVYSTNCTLVIPSSITIWVTLLRTFSTLHHSNCSKTNPRPMKAGLCNVFPYQYT